MASYTLAERIEQIKELLIGANGDGITVTDIAKRLFLSRHRVRQILQIMKKRGTVVETAVQGSYHHFGLMLYFHPPFFREMTDIEADTNHVYKLYQRTIFEIIGEKHHD